MRLRHDATLLALGGLLASGPALAQQSVHPGIIITPAPAQAGVGIETDDQFLQLEVFVNGRALNLISAFTLRTDGRLVSSFAELDQIGLKIPAALIKMIELPLDRLPGVTFVYDEAAQTIHFTAEARGLKPIRIDGHPVVPAPEPVRPPLGAVANYTLFTSLQNDATGTTFDGVAGTFETRLFGDLGLIEHSFIGRASERSSDLVRLDSSYTYEDPDGVRTFQGGDMIAGGFAWTRPIRMTGIQVRRSFGLRPDLITTPLPTLTGSAATPSTLDLFVNDVRALSADVPQGPFEIRHPPIIYGGGVASLVIKDALGRETVSTTPFYASPELLAQGFTDYSVELGMARRNYAVLSGDYDSRLAASASWRGGITDNLTLQAHGETAGSLIVLGGGAVFTVGHIGLASVAVSGSGTDENAGALLDVSFESRTPSLSLTLRSQRTFGDYNDLATWTAVLPANGANDRRVFEQPHALDQASVSTPLPWAGGSVGASYVDARRQTERTRLINVSYTQDLGAFSLFASGFTDLETRGSTGIFVGLIIPLGMGISGSVGGSHRRGATSAFVEASRQGSHEPGAIGWNVRATQGETQEIDGDARYGASFARFEVGAFKSKENFSAHGVMEGAVTLIGGGFHVSQRVDDSFALVEVGVPGIEISRENHVVGVTDARGQILVPNLNPFVVNRIALDPTNLPLDVEVAATSATVTPFSRVAALVDLRVETNSQSALISFVDRDGRPIELGSDVLIDGREEIFVVGYEGQAYVTGLSDRNVAIITTPNGAECRAGFDYRKTNGAQMRIDNVRCEPVR